jgi:hypothetical protein
MKGKAKNGKLKRAIILEKLTDNKRVKIFIVKKTNKKLKFTLKNTANPKTTNKEFKPKSPSSVVCLSSPNHLANTFVKITAANPQKPMVGFKKDASKISHAKVLFLEKKICE